VEREVELLRVHIERIVLDAAGLKWWGAGLMPVYKRGVKSSRRQEVEGRPGCEENVAILSLV